MLWFKKKEKNALDEAVRAAGKMATALVVEATVPKGHVFPPTATHFGGNPYGEVGDSWPTRAEDQRPYDFVCQINLHDCSDRPDLPFDLFAVFLCWSLLELGPCEEEACIVRTYRNALADKAVSLVRPNAYGPEDYQVRPCTVRTEPFVTYPWSMEGFPAIVKAASAFRNPELAYLESLKRLGFWHEFRSRVGGFPTWVHDNTLDGEDMVFVAQIDYERKANNCIGDAAPIFIASTKDDPPRIETDVFQSF
jgi:hypothetical protein